MWPPLNHHSSRSGHKLVTFLPLAKCTQCSSRAAQSLIQYSIKLEIQHLVTCINSKCKCGSLGQFRQVQVFRYGTSSSGDLGTKKISYLHPIYPTYNGETSTGKQQRAFKRVGAVEGKQQSLLIVTLDLIIVLKSSQACDVRALYFRGRDCCLIRDQFCFSEVLLQEPAFLSHKKQSSACS